MIKLSGYTRVEKPFKRLCLSADYVAVEEILSREPIEGIILPSLSHAQLGNVLKISPEASSYTGINEGDKILFKEWEGGRWAFVDEDSPSGELKCLIMSSEFILAKLDEDS